MEEDLLTDSWSAGFMPMKKTLIWSAIALFALVSWQSTAQPRYEVAVAGNGQPQVVIAQDNFREITDNTRVFSNTRYPYPCSAAPLFNRLKSQPVEFPILFFCVYDLKEFEMPLSASGGGGGVHANLADLPLSMLFDSVKHYDDYICRPLRAGVWYSSFPAAF